MKRSNRFWSVVLISTFFFALAGTCYFKNLKSYKGYNVIEEISYSLSPMKRDARRLVKMEREQNELSQQRKENWESWKRKELPFNEWNKNDSIIKGKLMVLDEELDLFRISLAIKYITRPYECKEAFEKERKRQRLIDIKK